MISVYVKHFGTKKFTQTNRWPTLSPSDSKAIETVRKWVSEHRPASSSSIWQIRAGVTGVIETIQPDKSKGAIEMPMGRNRDCLKTIIGNIHVATSMLEVQRIVIRRKMTMANFRKLPRGMQ